MPRTVADQIPFRYRSTDTPSGVTRATAKLVAEKLGVDETQVIHMALRELAIRVLPQYELDDGPLSDEAIEQLRSSHPQGTQRLIRSSLFRDPSAE